MGSGGTMFGGLGMLLIWGVIVAVIVFAARGLIGSASRSPNRPSRSGSAALDILQQRFAKGEISKDEYEERKKTLSE